MFFCEFICISLFNKSLDFFASIEKINSVTVTIILMFTGRSDVVWQTHFIFPAQL